MLKEYEYDVTIVGAGPAGSTAANILSKNDKKTILIDKEKFPRTKACGGGLTDKTIKKIPSIDNIIESESFECILYSSSLTNKATLVKDKPIISMISRYSFDNYLLKKAIDNGTDFLENTKVENIEILNDKIITYIKNDKKIHSKLIIGSDGFNSIIAKKAGLQKNKIFGISIFDEIPLSKDVIIKYFSKKLICHMYLQFGGVSGYGWVFPKESSINVGIVDYRIIGKNKKIELKKIFEDFLNTLKNKNIIPNYIKKVNPKNGFLPFCPLEKTYTDRIILCGDAGGFINPLTGEGIYYAISSGEIAAKVAIKAIESNNFNNNFLSEYEDIWKSKFGLNIIKMINIAKKYTHNSEEFIKILNNDKKLFEELF
jgi:geranylgeranyl reductase family protein